MPREILPDWATLDRLHRKMTYAEIAAKYGVTENAVYLKIRRDRPQLIDNRPRYADLIPWRVRSDHLYAVPPTYLRLLARRRRGEELKPAQDRRLDAWLAMLDRDNLVVDYDPEEPPNPASPTYGGWKYVPRSEGDGPDPIRVPAT